MNINQLVKRFFDLTLAILATLLLIPIASLVAICIYLSSPGPIVYWSKRIGTNNQPFQMPKFRTMKVDTPVIATHLLKNPNKCLTPIGSFLRKTSLDEIPQLWSILKGDMSFVGPRPALYNQDDLIILRTEKSVHKIKPGLTGWAQVNGRDEIPISTKVALDEEYLQIQSFWIDIKIIALTFIKVIKTEGVNH